MGMISEAVQSAITAAPDFLRNATPVPAFADESRVILTYQREAPEGVLLDAWAAVVDRSGATSVVPFVSLMDELEGMTEL